MHYLKGYFGPGQTVLDVGCGDGTCMALVGEQGATIHGLEPDGPAAQEARAKGYIVKQSLVEDAFLPQKFDGHCLFHVLNQVRYPLDVLKALKEKTVEGGRLFIEVPSLHNVFHAYLMPPQWKHFRKATLWTFSPKSLRTLVEEAGWVVAREIPYQQESFLAHVRQASHGGPVPPLQVGGPLQDILHELDLHYKMAVSKRGMQDTLLMVAVNA